MAAFDEGDALQRYMAEENLSEEEVTAVRDIFSQFDGSGDDTMDAFELRELLEGGLHGSYTAAELDVVVQEIDVSADGRIVFVEFLRWWINGKSGLSNGDGFEEKDRKERELAPGIRLTTLRLQDLATKCTHLRYVLYVQKSMLVAMKIRFAGSENVEIYDAGAADVDDKDFMVIHQDAQSVQPYRRTMLAEVKQADPQLGWRLKTGYTWSERPWTSLALRRVSNAADDVPGKLAAYRNFQRRSSFRPQVDPPSLIAQRMALADDLPEFCDIHFPPQSDSIYSEDSIRTPWTHEKYDKQQRVKEKRAAKGGGSIVWRRALQEPEGFCDGPPQVVAGEIEPLDVRQGSLGDCWFMCALASVSEFPHLVRHLVEPEGVAEKGLYRVLFHKSGRWTPVTVDDHFPCKNTGKPIFSRANGDELWVLLLEKAYAKLHGSYYTLRGGFPREGLMDLTGMPVFEIDLDTLGAATNKYCDDAAAAEGIDRPGVKGLWEELAKWDANCYLMSCTTPGKDTKTEGGDRGGSGLVPGHAYTILNAAEVDGHRLLRIRNPWGSFEWGGEFGDSDPRWNDSGFKAKLGAACVPPLAEDEVIVAEDGCFWMAYADYINTFMDMSVCMINDIGGGAWARAERGGRATVGAKGAPHLPVYRLMLEGSAPEVNVILSMYQMDERVLGNPPYLDFGAVVGTWDGDVFELVHDDDGMPVQVPLERGRETFSPVARLSTGVEYLVVPWTSGLYLSSVGARCADADFALNGGISGDTSADEAWWDNYTVNVRAEIASRSTNDEPRIAVGHYWGGIAAMATEVHERFDVNPPFGLFNRYEARFLLEAVADEHVAFKSALKRELDERGTRGISKADLADVFMSLIMDDDPAVLDGFMLMLQGLGYVAAARVETESSHMPLLSAARPFTAVVYAGCDSAELEECGADDQEAMFIRERAITALTLDPAVGVEQVKGKGRYSIHVGSWSYDCATIVARNPDTAPLELSLDMSASQAGRSHRQTGRLPLVVPKAGGAAAANDEEVDTEGLTAEVTLGPNEAVLMHHMGPASYGVGWGYAFRSRFKEVS